MAKRAKKYNEVLEKIDQEKLYSIEEAVALVVESSTTKFDSTIEVHYNLNCDVKHADQIVRGTISLPNGTGKTVRIAAFVEADQVKAAKDAGAEMAGLEELIDEVKKGNINFDIAVAQPQVMKNLGKIARDLGTKGLMPNPKAGTVSADIVKTITEIKKGKMEYKTDKNGLIHSIIGKVSFGKDKIKENLEALTDVIKEAKPNAIKGIYINSISISTTMGPGIKIQS